MNNNLKNISNIEDFLFETFYGKVSNNVYISNLPYNIKEDIEDMDEELFRKTFRRQHL